MGELTAIGFTPGRSLLHRLDPRTKQALIMVMGAVSVKGGMTFLVLVTAVMALMGHAAGLSIGRVIRETRYFLLFLLFVFLVRLAVVAPGKSTVSIQAAVDAGLICWRLLLVVGMGLLLMATTRITHIRAALVWYLKPVPWVDERMTATMVGLIVRFLPLILQQAAEMTDAQRARGIDRRKNPLTRLIRATIPLFRRVFLGADELTTAMQARCYNDRRTLPELAFSYTDAIAVAWALGVVACAALP